jgi:hypothetical protein
VIHWRFTHIDVFRSPHYAVNNLTREAPSIARPEACYTPSRTRWLSVGVPHLPPVCCGPKPDSDCRIPVVLALQRVPDCACVASWASRQTGRPRRAALRGRADDHCGALAQALSGRLTHSGPACRWLHAIGWVWQRAKRVAQEEAPLRILSTV